MIITIIADLLGEDDSGATITTKRMIATLKERGHQIRVVSPIENKSENYFYSGKRHVVLFRKYCRNSRLNFARLNTAMLKEAIAGSDIVHIMHPFKLGKKAKEICLEWGIPFTTAFHFQPEEFSSQLKLKFSKFNDFLYNKLYKNFYKDARFVHCPSSYIESRLKLYNYDLKTYVISSGVIPTFNKKKLVKPAELKDKFVILFTGRLSDEKRHDVLINAVKSSKYQDKIQLIFAGCGVNEKKIRRLSSGLTNAPIIKFFSKEALSDVMNFSDLYVHPCEVESEAISCLEAISCGLVPIISNSRSSSAKDLALTEENLFEAGNVLSLTEKIDYWFEHSEYRALLSKSYIEFSKRFSIDKSIDELEIMFEDAIIENMKSLNQEYILKKQAII